MGKMLKRISVMVDSAQYSAWKRLVRKEISPFLREKMAEEVAKRAKTGEN